MLSTIRVDGEETFLFFLQIVETGKQTSSVKSSGASHYPRAPDRDILLLTKSWQCSAQSADCPGNKGTLLTTSQISPAPRTPAFPIRPAPDCCRFHVRPVYPDVETTSAFFYFRSHDTNGHSSSTNY